VRVIHKISHESGAAVFVMKVSVKVAVEIN
jgi:hypothetical protein